MSSESLTASDGPMLSGSIVTYFCGFLVRTKSLFCISVGTKLRMVIVLLLEVSPRGGWMSCDPCAEVSLVPVKALPILSAA